jgi:hypothetical protein
MEGVFRMTEREEDERDLAILDYLTRGGSPSAAARLFNVTVEYVEVLVDESK